ncbi:fumarate hydratase [Candidatus Saganbacteria bacterium]|nr:fumarate hydratase [Candidatus Saganbacteria bacterium]
MREIAASKIKASVANLCSLAAYDLPQDLEEVLNHDLAHETSPLGRQIISEIIKNAEIARHKKLPICQDTGMACVFVELGQDVHILDGDITESINEGVSLGYKDLRKSIVSDPFHRVNTNDNTPANIHLEIVPGDKIKITVLLKGGGAENASFVQMFLPTAKKEEIVDFIVKKVKENGPKACPPIIVGVGIGGSFDTVAYLAKKSLIRPVKSHNSAFEIAEFEKEMLEKINKTGVGPMGVGGNITALAVHIITAPCHIASLPVAVNFGCHANRYKEIIL